MPAIHSNLSIEQGATWSHGWLVSFNGELIDATWTARGQVRSSVKASTILLDLDPTVNTDGSVVVAVEPEVSALWTWRNGVYDVEVESPDGVVLRISEGRLSVDPEVTR